MKFWLDELPELQELGRHVDCVLNKNLHHAEESVDKQKLSLRN